MSRADKTRSAPQAANRSRSSRPARSARAVSAPSELIYAARSPPAGLRRRSPPSSGGTPPRRRAGATYGPEGPDSERSRCHRTGARRHATHARTPPQLQLGRCALGPDACQRRCSSACSFTQWLPLGLPRSDARCAHGLVPSMRRIASSVKRGSGVRVDRPRSHVPSADTGHRGRRDRPADRPQLRERVLPLPEAI